MQGHDKDDLSRFFRKATQKPEIKFNEDDWTKLEAMLDNATANGAAAASRNKRIKFMAAAVIGMIVLSGITYFVANPSHDGQASLSPSAQNKDIVIAKKDRKLSNAQGVNENKSQHDGSMALQGKESREVNTQSAHVTITTRSLHPAVSLRKKGNVLATSRLFDTDRSPERNNGDATQDEKLDSDATPGNEKSVVTRGGHSDEAFITQSTLFADETNERLSATGPLPQHRSNKMEIADEHDAPDSLNNALALASPKDSTTTVPIDSSREGDKTTQPSRWSILLSLAPDFSSNSFQHTTSPGEAVGVSVYYRIATRLNVFVGVIGSNKKYVSYGKEYKPKEDHYWAKHTNGMLPTEIDGSCFMLEIPVGIQYEAVRTKSSRVLVSGMVSNYTMFNESYAYVFPTENPGAAQGWKSKKTTSYPFSVIGASVSFEHDLSSRLAVGFSPYLKIPLRDMGTWTTMRLYSVGAALTFRYHFQTNKTSQHRERSD